MSEQDLGLIQIRQAEIDLDAHLRVLKDPQDGDRLEARFQAFMGAISATRRVNNLVSGSPNSFRRAAEAGELVSREPTNQEQLASAVATAIEEIAKGNIAAASVTRLEVVQDTENMFID